MFFDNPKKKFTKQNQLEFFDVMSNYVNSGISPVEAVKLYRDSISPDLMAYKVTGEALKDMRNGLSLAEALGKKPGQFPEFAVGLLRVAQETGQLGPVLKEIVYHLDLTLDISRRVSKATMMPKISAIGIFIVFMFGTSYVIPKLGDTLTDMHVELPMITRIVLTMGNFMSSFWWVIAILVFVLFSMWKGFRKKNPEKAEWIVMNLPLWKQVAYARIKYNFCAIMSLCVGAGVRPGQALSYTAQGVGCMRMKNSILRATRHIANGMGLDTALRREDKDALLDAGLYTMIATGAATGNMGLIMGKQAENYRKKLEDASTQIGDKFGVFVLIPCYIAIIVLLGAIEYPVITLGANITSGG